MYQPTDIYWVKMHSRMARCLQDRAEFENFQNRVFIVCQNRLGVTPILTTSCTLHACSEFHSCFGCLLDDFATSPKHKSRGKRIFRAFSVHVTYL